MSDLLPLALALLAGAGLGLFYYGGLWLTVQRVTSCRWPALVTLGSFFVRTAVTLAAFYLVMDGRWERLAASLLGFFILRTILVRRWRPPASTAQLRSMSDDNQPG